MSYQKILVSVSGAYKEIDASIDGSLLSSSLTISTTTASIPLNNGLLAVSGGLLTTITGSTANQIIQYTNNSTQIKSLAETVSAGSGDLNYSSGKIQVTNISNVTGGVLSSLYGGTGPAIPASGSIVTSDGGVGNSYPYVLSHYTSSNIADDSYFKNSIVYYNASIATPPVVSPFGGNALSCSYNSANSARQSYINFKNTQRGDFTAECWAYLVNTGTSGDASVQSILFNVSDGVTYSFELGLTAAGVFNVYQGGGRPSFNLSYTPNTWQHLALVRRGNKIQLFVNGTGSNLIDIPSVYYNASYSFCSVGSTTWGASINGYITQFAYFRHAKPAKEIKEYYNAVITGAKQRYTKNDSSQYPVNDYTTAIGMSNLISYTGTDDSLEKNGMTLYNASFVNPVTPIPGGIITGSVLSSSYAGNDSTTNSKKLSIEVSNPTSGDFTLESWVYIAPGSGQPDTRFTNLIFGMGPYTGGADVYELAIHSNGYFSCWTGAEKDVQTFNLQYTLNAWQHVAFIRKGYKIQIYVNGQASNTIDVSPRSYFISYNKIFLGCTQWGGSLNGYMSEFCYSSYAKSQKQIKDYYNSILAGSRGRMTGLETSNNKIITVNTGGTLAYRDKSYTEITLPTYPLAYLYTGNVGSAGSYTWTKPQGCRMVRVICQGGGGGGAKAGTSSGYNYASGGGGGGYSTTIFSGDGLPSTILITAGAGGTGGYRITNISTGVNGAAGGISSFGSYLSATGGAGGAAGSSTMSTNAGGIGYTYNGGVGSTTNNITSDRAGNINKVLPESSVYLGGAGGGAGAGAYSGGSAGQLARPGGSITALGLIGTATGYDTVLQSPAASPLGDMFPLITQAFINNGTLQALPDLVQAGGSGGSSPNSGTTGGNGASCSYGSGGGGGSRQPTAGSVTNGQGGNGGVGYVLIICY